MWRKLVGGLLLPPAEEIAQGHAFDERPISGPRSPNWRYTFER